MIDHKEILPDYDLLAKYFAGEASTVQTQAIEEWVTDPVNKKAYDRMHFLWMQSAKTELEKQVKVDDAWTKMQFKMNAAKQPKAAVPAPPKEISIGRKTTYRFLQFAAIIIIALGINFIIKFLNTEDYISKESQTAVINVTLPDNSEIKLNKASKISFPEKFKGEKRNVKLEGEAFFDVKHNAEKPFVIEAQFAKIKVLGTSFNVQAFDTANVVEVTVVTGKVELSDAESNNKLLLTKGQKGKIEKHSGKLIKEDEVDMNEVFGVEKDMVFMFKDTELSVVAETLKVAYNIEVEFTKEELKHCLLDTRFDNPTIDEIIAILQISFPNLIIDKKANKLTIDGIPCKEQ